MGVTGDNFPYLRLYRLSYRPISAEPGSRSQRAKTSLLGRSDVTLYYPEHLPGESGSDEDHSFRSASGRS